MLRFAIRKIHLYSSISGLKLCIFSATNIGKDNLHVSRLLYSDKDMSISIEGPESELAGGFEGSFKNINILL